MRASVAVAMLAAAGLAATASAQSITTLFNSNNGGSAGGAVYFDITVGANPIRITGLDTNTSATVAFGWTVYTAPGTSVGFETSPGSWTQVSTGTGQGMGTDIPSPVTLDNSFVLDAGTSYGLAFVIGSEASHRYSGTGSSPSPGELQYSNADVTLDLGSATNVPFSGSPFRPRVWNGTIYYEVIPAPASLALLGLGGLAATRRRR
jgi:hypothetical protein